MTRASTVPRFGRLLTRSRDLVGHAISRLQDTSVVFDDLAAEILAIDRADLPCITRLLFGGPASIDELAETMRLKRGMVLATVERLQLAGYARFHPDDSARIELTEHARRWVERIWAPVRYEGNRLLDTYSTRQLVLFATFLRKATEVQEAVTKRLRTWLESPSSPARRPHLRGGLSPAALRRAGVRRSEPRELDSSSRSRRPCGVESLPFRSRLPALGRADATRIRRAPANRIGKTSPA